MQQELVMGVRDYVKMLRERVSHITGQPLGGVGLDGKYAGSGDNGALSLELSKNASLEQGEGESATVGLGLRVERLVEELKERTRLKNLNIETVKNSAIIGMSQTGKAEAPVGEQPVEEGQAGNLESVWDQHFSNEPHKVPDLASRDQESGKSPGASAQKNLGDEMNHERQLGEEVEPEPLHDRDQALDSEEELDLKPHDGSWSDSMDTGEPQASVEEDPEKSGVDLVDVGQEGKVQIQPRLHSWSPGSPESPTDGQLRIPQMAKELGHRVFATHFPSASDRVVGKEQDDLSSKHDHPGEKANVAEANLQSGDAEQPENTESTKSPPKLTGYSRERHVPEKVAGGHREGVPDFPSGLKPEEEEIGATIPEAKSDGSAPVQKDVGEGAQWEEKPLRHLHLPSKSSGSPDGPSRLARPLERSHQEGRGHQSKLEEYEEQAQAQTQESTVKSAQHSGEPGPTKRIGGDLAEDEDHLDAQGDHDVQAARDANVPEPRYDERERESSDEITKNDRSAFAAEELDVAPHADQDKMRTHERHPQQLEVLDSEQGGNVGLGISAAGDNSKLQQVEDEREVQASKDLQATRPLHETQNEDQLEMLHFKEQGDEELPALQGHEDEEHADLAGGSSTEAHVKGKAQVDLEIERNTPDTHVLKDEQQCADTTPTDAGAVKEVGDLERPKKQELPTDLEDLAGKVSADDPRRQPTEPEFTSVLNRSAVTADASESRAEVTGDVQSNRRLTASHEEEYSQNAEDGGHREAIAPQERKISASDVGEGIGNYEYHQPNEHVTKWLRTLQHGSVATPHSVERKEEQEEDSRHEAVLSKGTEFTKSAGTGVVNPDKGRESMPRRQPGGSGELVQDLVRSESPEERLSKLLQLSGGVTGPSGTEIQETDTKHESATLGPHAGSETEENLPKESLVRNEQPKKRLRGRWHRSVQARKREDQNATHPSEEGSSRRLLGRLPHFLRDKSGESGEVVTRGNDNHRRRRLHLPHFSRLAHAKRRPGDKSDKEDPERTREAVVGNAASSDINREKQGTGEKDERGLTFGFRERFRRIRQMMASTSSDDESDEVKDDSENAGRGQRLMRKVREVRRSKDEVNESISVDEEPGPKEVFDLEIRVDMGGVGGKEEEIGIGEEATGSRRVNDGCVSFIVPQGWTARRLNEGFALSKERAVGFVWAVDGAAVHHILLQTERLALPSTVNIAASPVFISKTVICVEYHCHYYAARAIARFEDSESKVAVLVSLAIPDKYGGRRVLAKMEDVLMRSICILGDPPKIDVGGTRPRKVEQAHSASYTDNTKCTVQ